MRTSTAFLVTIVVSLALASLGCAHHQPQTARHLEQGEEEMSLSISLPGYTLLPRVGVQGVYGFGFGDADIHTGTSLGTVETGGGFRLYAGDVVHLETDVMYQFLLAPYDKTPLFGRPNDNIYDIFSARAGFGTTVGPGRPVFGGIYANARVTGPATDEDLENGGLFPTATLGYQTPSPEGSTSFQIALTAPLFRWDSGRIHSPFSRNSVNFLAQTTQISAGWHWQ